MEIRKRAHSRPVSRVHGIWLTALLAAALASLCGSLPNQVKVGILLHEHQYEQELLFKWSIEQLNQKAVLNGTRLQGVIRRVEAGDSWDAEKRSCELLKDGAVAIIGPTDAQTNQHVASICDALDIPHFNVMQRKVAFSSQIGSSLSTSPPSQSAASASIQSTISVDLSIPRSTHILAYLELVQAMEWKDFVYLYEEDDSLFNFQEHFDGESLKGADMNVRILRFDPTKPYRDTFWVLKRTNIRHIMLDVRCSNLKTVLKHAQQVSMMTEVHGYLIVCLDMLTMDLEDFRYGRSRIVWLNLFNQQSASMKELMSHQTVETGFRFFGSSFRLAPERLKTESALIHDSIETVARALQGVDSSQNIGLPSSVSCERSKPWPHGSTIVNFLRTSVEFEGMTGQVRFDQTGQRSSFVLHINRLASDGARLIGNWTEESLAVDAEELRYLQRGDLALSENDLKDLLVVTSIRNEPYFMNKQTSKVEVGNGRFEGYAIDLIDELSRLVGFDYVFKEVDDGKYGKYDEITKEWNGMIKEIMIGKADLAIGDLSITSIREDAVDFTLPFMSTGISILFKKPTTKELELFSFLSPFETHVWYYVCGSYIGVSLLLFAVGRVSPYEWADPHPCRQEDKILRNQFSLANSFWFIIAAVMQQGSDLAPRSLSTRIIASFWYFFTIIMISSYTANLAAFLTVEKVVYPIEKAQDLYKHPQHIRYGCVESGSTGTFFQQSKNTSTYKKMYQDMVFMKGQDQGKAEVEKGNYAFFMESISIEYIIERNCNLTQIGGLLDSKGYGIALAKNSTRKRDYRTKLSEAILSLQESGTLEVLKNRWWKEKRGGGACDPESSHSSESVKELTLENVGGVFVVLAMGITCSFLFCALEIYAKSRRLAQAQGTSLSEQINRRLKFALELSENY